MSNKKEPTARELEKQTRCLRLPMLLKRQRIPPS